MKIASLSTRPKVQPATRKSRAPSHVDTNDDHGCRTQGWVNEKSRRGSQQARERRNLLVGTFEGESGRLLLISFAPIDTTFTCLFCHHDNSVNIRVDRKEGVALLVCKVCDQRYQSKVNRTSSFTWIVPLVHLTHPARDIRFDRGYRHLF